MQLFDEFERTETRPMNYNEPEFTYLNICARSVCFKIRHILEEWFSHYPESEKPDLYGRFCSRRNEQHQSAFFELFLHELLLRLGCKVIIHPKTGSDKGKHPDFLVESPNSNSFYMEAVVAIGKSKKEKANEAIKEAVMDEINKLNSPNFLIGIEDINGTPDSQPSGKKIRSFLSGKLKSLDPDKIAKLYQSKGYKYLPRWYYKHEGWTICFLAYPKAYENRGEKTNRVIGTITSQIRELKLSKSIRDSIIEKAKKYGSLDLPYVISLNALDIRGGEKDVIMEALFGDEQYIVKKDKKGIISDPQFTRALNGAFTSKSKPRYRNVSAVLITESLSPWNIIEACIRLYHNPWALIPYNSVLTSLPQAIPKNGKMEWKDGESIETIFDLPSSWPK